MKSVKGKSSSGRADLSLRASGVLLHITSLPGPYGIGDLGPSALQWIDRLAGADQKWWQILPLGPTGEGNSPYRCFSAFAGNPLLISPESLLVDGLLDRSDLKNQRLPGGRVNYAKATQLKFLLLRKAFAQFSKASDDSLAADYKKFIQREAGWLDDFALFMALREANPDQLWTSWPKPVLRRTVGALNSVRSTHEKSINFHMFCQFIFTRQLRALRSHAGQAGVSLLGDLPIFISPESVDVWTHPHLFQLDKNMRPRAVAGVPPDLFSSTGQRWGNPLYEWKTMAKDDFAWWKARLASALGQADLVRIDHFRGFEAYWRIPATCPTAQEGTWVKAPGVELFNSLQKRYGNLPLLAEDLGIITPPVEQLRDQFNLPGMRVLQFAFPGPTDSTHMPHNYIPHCFAYTGTHDNDTSAGWYSTLDSKGRKSIDAYAPNQQWKTQPAQTLMRMLFASVAANVIVPAQDLLGLDSKARMNVPGKSDGNWSWRLDSLEVCDKPFAHLKQITKIYGRAAKT